MEHLMGIGNDWIVPGVCLNHNDCLLTGPGNVYTFLYKFMRGEGVGIYMTGLGGEIRMARLGQS